MAAPAGPRPRIDILEEHFAELVSLWEQRESVVFAPDWLMSELGDLEERAAAHLDGLVLGGEPAIAIARPALAGELVFPAAACGFLLLALGRRDFETEVREAFVAGPPQVRDGLRIALRHLAPPALVDVLEDVAVRGTPEVRVAALDVLAFHRRKAPRLVDLFAPDLEIPRDLFYGALGRFGGPWNTDMLATGLEDPSPAVRRAALDASARIGVPQLREFCRSSARGSAEALAYLGVVGTVQDVAAITSFLPDEVLGPAALEALGALGLVDVVPHLLRAMEHPALAAAAGVAFARMTAATGIAAAEAPPAPADSSPSAEQPEQGAEALPEPEPPLDPAKAAAWWKENADRFAPDKRWQAGIDVTGAATDRGLLDRLPLAIRRDEYLRGRAAGGQVPDLELEACVTFRAGPA